MPVKPTLLVTASTFPRWKGDSEPRFVYDLCVRLTNTFNVIVLAPHADGAACYEKHAKLHVHRYRYAPAALETLAYESGITANLKHQPWKYLLLPGFFIAQWFTLHKLLKTYSVHVIHAHWLIPQGLVAGLATRWQKQRPALLCTSHGGDLFGLQGKLSLILKRWVVNHCQAITVVSSPMVEKIRELADEYPVPVEVIPMGTDLSNTFVPNPEVKRLPNQLLFVGRLVEKKGVKYLLHALKELSKTLPDTRLVIAGSGPLQANLEKLTVDLGLSSRVKFTGRLEHAELVQLYQESTAAVFPFVQAKDGDMEGLGLVMVEAMGCGCSVIASDLPAIHDVIISGETGILVEPEDPTALANSICTLLKKQTLHEQTTAQKSKITHTNFDWRSVTQRYENLLHLTITQPEKRRIVHAQ